MKRLFLVRYLLAATVTLSFVFSDNHAAAELPPPATTGIGQVLVLKNGRTLEGIVNRSSAGYVVQKPTGSLSIDDDLVLFVAANRAEAYTKARGTIDVNQAGDHVKLASWCLTNGYHDEAAAELREALELQPSSQEARLMLARLETIVNPQQPRHQTVTKPTPRTLDGFDQPEVKSLGNLSREAGLEFVSKVQPILMNKCATSGCHGPAETNTFRLERVTGGTNRHRIFTERNLATVFQQIDLANPDQSPLLVVPKGSHGRKGSTIFSGPGSAEQLETLRTWVLSVAGTKQSEQQVEASRVTLLKGRGPLTDSSPLADGVRAVDRGRKDGKGQQISDDLLDAALREQQPDAFDPRNFNNRYHGPGRRRNSLSGN